MVHYGHACMSQYVLPLRRYLRLIVLHRTSRLPVIYVFGKKPIDVDDCSERLPEVFEGTGAILRCNVAYAHQAGVCKPPCDSISLNGARKHRRRLAPILASSDIRSAARASSLSDSCGGRTYDLGTGPRKHHLHWWREPWADEPPHNQLYVRCTYLFPQILSGFELAV
jgi:hypothetical protein